MDRSCMDTWNEGAQKFVRVECLKKKKNFLAKQ